jgi:hypothetical protein
MVLSKKRWMYGKASDKTCALVAGVKWVVGIIDLSNEMLNFNPIALTDYSVLRGFYKNQLK